jgi:electron transport complex protein RnfC
MPADAGRQADPGYPLVSAQEFRSCAIIALFMQIALSPAILEAALAGLEARRQQLDEQIANIRAMVGRRATRPAVRAVPTIVRRTAAAAPAKRTMSAAGRKRIIEAAKRRWAAHRQQQEAAQEPAAKTAPAKRGRRAVKKAGRKSRKQAPAASAAQAAS